jgi:hypothetical protein
MTSPADIPVVCPSCHAAALANVAGMSFYRFDEADIVGRYTYAACSKCDHPIIFQQEWESWDDEYEIPAPRVIYPSDTKVFGGQIPAPVKIAFEEAETCFKAGAHTASPLMCRRCLEAIAHDQNATGNGLIGKIKNLESKGVITKDFVDWFDMLRQVGNQAAHDVTAPVSLSDAKDTLDFTHAILEFIYTYRQRFDEFRNRRAKVANIVASTTSAP